ncbi:MAG: YqcI/YcgG family protein [Burkholderiaceae bacterium]|nr:YqcI/YcgG family protein [Burkholderiaceae bacterium]
MDSHLLRRADVPASHPASDSWQRIVFAEFEAALTSPARPFPCTFGAAGFKADQLRYAFCNELTPSAVASALTAYLPGARACGPNTSLVIFEAPRTAPGTVEQHEQRFWQLLRGTAALDAAAWPKHVPTELDEPLWEFCFAGEPIFVVCNTPAHVLRQSRRASGFMLTFQPRWVFDQILGTPEASERSVGIVSRRLAAFDLVPRCPALGSYGQADVREWKRYFLPDENIAATQPCATLRDVEA